MERAQTAVAEAELQDGGAVAGDGGDVAARPQRGDAHAMLGPTADVGPSKSVDEARHTHSRKQVAIGQNGHTGASPSASALASVSSAGALALAANRAYLACSGCVSIPTAA